LRLITASTSPASNGGGVGIANPDLDVGISGKALTGDRGTALSEVYGDDDISKPSQMLGHDAGAAAHVGDAAWRMARWPDSAAAAEWCSAIRDARGSRRHGLRRDVG
jgi:hypothetical protein